MTTENLATCPGARRFGGSWVSFGAAQPARQPRLRAMTRVAARPFVKPKHDGVPIAGGPRRGSRRHVRRRRRTGGAGPTRDGFDVDRRVGVKTGVGWRISAAPPCHIAPEYPGRFSAPFASRRRQRHHHGWSRPASATPPIFASKRWSDSPGRSRRSALLGGRRIVPAFVGRSCGLWSLAVSLGGPGHHHCLL